MAGFLTALLHAWLLLQGGGAREAASKDSFPLPKTKTLLLGLINPSSSLDLHAEQLQQRGEDPHVVEQKDVVSGPAEDIRLAVALVKGPWGGAEDRR